MPLALGHPLLKWRLSSLLWRQEQFVPLNAKRPQRTSEGPPVPTLTKRAERSYLAALYWTAAVLGWNDGSTGPLLLRIEQNYDITYTIVSLIFVSGFLGYVVAAFLNVTLTDRLGFGKVRVVGSVTQACPQLVIAYAIEASAPPFPAFVVAFAFNGFGAALVGAQANVLVACLSNSGPKLQLLHACYGIGAFVSPLAATQFAQLPHWSYQYLISLSMSIIQVILMAGIFRFRSQAQLLGTPVHVRQDNGNKYAQILRLKNVHLLSSFILCYVGAEVTIGGWIVTYLVEVRGGGPSAGYVASGFWGGLTVGRLALIWINEKLGVRVVIFAYLALAIILELLVWFVPSIIGDAVAVSFVGVLLGPFYPLVVGASSRILPQWLLAGCIGWIASFGTAGSAVFPFITGALAQKYGIKVLQPMLVAILATMSGIWALVPLPPRRVD